MTGVLQSLDSMPRPFVMFCMVVGFILFWPIGLAILAYMMWSRRMGCASYSNHGDRFGHWAQRNQAMADRWERKSERFMRKMNDKMDRWSGGPRSRFATTGNVAFDEYREETLRRLEDEASEFNEFMSRLRMARDKSEFDQYMAERKGTGLPDVSDDKPQAN
jgi:hypothetical protein